MLTADAQLDYWKLARQGACLSGALPVAGFRRLAASAECLGEVSLSCRLSVDEEGRARVAGGAKVGVRLVCQKCLEAYETELRCALDSVIVRDEAALSALAPEVDGVLAAGERLAVADLCEDELLLALPMAPRHAEGECRLPAALAAAPPAGNGDGETQRPFAALGQQLAERQRRNRPNRETADGSSAE